MSYLSRDMEDFSKYDHNAGAGEMTIEWCNSKSVKVYQVKSKTRWKNVRGENKSDEAILNKNHCVINK